MLGDTFFADEDLLNEVVEDKSVDNDIDIEDIPLNKPYFHSEDDEYTPIEKNEILNSLNEVEIKAIKATVILLSKEKITDRNAFWKRLSFYLRKHKNISKIQIFHVYQQLVNRKVITSNAYWSRFLCKKDIRSSSGVLVITVLTEPYSCPGKCIYCPTQPNMPKSYLSSEPAVARAIENEFDCVQQVTSRLRTLQENGHPIDKLEILVLGGSWSAYPLDYQETFIRDIYFAVNIFLESESKREPYDLMREQSLNEVSAVKIIGLTLETRPDLITRDEIIRMRRYGCTRLQLGIQHTDDDVLKLTHRGHSYQRSVLATLLLKWSGFKVDHHYMPNSPGSTIEMDYKMFKEKIFGSQDLRPDQIKIYPCIVNEYAELYKWYLDGKFQCYSDDELLDLICRIKQHVPPYVRINRVVRDFSPSDIYAGCNKGNLRQMVLDKLKKENKRCNCIRCREVRGNQIDPDQVVFIVRTYSASSGTEFFFSFETRNHLTIFSFLRLRFNNIYLEEKESTYEITFNNNDIIMPIITEFKHMVKPDTNIDLSKAFIFPELHNTALIRELHVYGYLAVTRSNQNVPSPDDLQSNAQHLGFGKVLLKIAEITSKIHGFKRIAVISGIGVRNYYRSNGYHLRGTYMVKELTD